MSSVSTAFKVHYNQKLGDPFGHLGGERTMAFGGDRRPCQMKSKSGAEWAAIRLQRRPEWCPSGISFGLTPVLDHRYKPQLLHAD